MALYAVKANELKVYFDKDVFLTFKMHADLSMDLLRWLQAQIKRLEVMGKRADKMEAKAVDLDINETARFVQLTQEADGLRSKGGDAIDVMVEYVKRACVAWTDYFEDAEAEQRGEVLAFTDANIARIGIAKLNRIITAFNVHYGLVDDDAGKASGERSGVLSPSSNQAVAAQEVSPKSLLKSTPNTSNSVPTV